MNCLHYITEATIVAECIVEVIEILSCAVLIKVVPKLNAMVRNLKYIIFK